MSDYRGGEAVEVWLLREILEAQRQQIAEQEKIYRLLHHFIKPEVSFDEVILEGDDMALQQPDPGATIQYTAQFTLKGAPATLPTGTVPTWTISDTTNTTLTIDSTGLIATIVLGTGIQVGESVTLTVSATNESGTVVTGTATFTVGQAPPVATFDGVTLTQTE